MTSNTPLKLLTLNIWGGHILSPLLKFVKSHESIDIFCFQEVFSQGANKVAPHKEREKCLNIQERISKLLPDHRVFFRPVINGNYGISTLVHKNIVVLEEGEHNIYTNRNYSGQGPSHSRILQWIKIFTGFRELAILNVHGLWNGKGKTDSPERITQSNHIKNFINTLSTSVILAGDFNLMPDTESLKILANGMQDFVKNKNITSTRSSFYKKSERYADYIFASQDIKATRFAVLDDEVSDHLPLYLEFMR